MSHQIHLGRRATTAARRINVGVLGKLNREWQQLCAEPDTADQVRAWGQVEPELAGLADLAAVEERVRGLASRACDALLLALLRLAHKEHQARQERQALLARSARQERGERSQERSFELAGRTLLQLMLPKAVRIAATQAGRFASVEESRATTIGCLWEVICTYPLLRRPRSVAANLGLDTLSAMRRLATGDQEVPQGSMVGSSHSMPEDDIVVEQTWEDRIDRDLPRTLTTALEWRIVDASDEFAVEALLADTAVSARAEMLHLLVWAVQERVLSPDDAALLARTYAPTHRGDQSLASQTGCRPNTLRVRRRRALARLDSAAQRAQHAMAA